MNYDQIHLACDGGARGNPGPAAVGVAITIVEEEKSYLLTNISRTIGIATNNEAEYQSVLIGLSYLREQGIRAKLVAIQMDSQVVSQQLRGVYKIKKPHLRNLFLSVKTLESQVGERVIYKHVPRAQNHLADALVNQALDRV